MDALDDGSAQSHIVFLAADELGQLQALQHCALGQHAVRRQSGLAHLHVNSHHKLCLGKRLAPLCRLRIPLHGVGVVEEHALDDAVGAAVQHGQVGAGARERQRVLGVAQTLGGRLGHLGELHRIHVAHLGRRGDERSALLPPAAKKRIHGAHRASRLEGVLIGAAERCPPGRLDSAGRCGGGQRLGDFHDGIGRHIADALGPFRRVLGHLSSELREAHGGLLNERVIVQVARHQHVRDAEQERDISAGPDRHPVSSKDAGVVQARIHDDHPRPALGRSGQALHRGGTDAIAIAAADEHHHFGVGEVHREVLGTRTPWRGCRRRRACTRWGCRARS